MPRMRPTSRERSSDATTARPISPVGPVTATVRGFSAVPRGAIDSRCSAFDDAPASRVRRTLGGVLLASASLGQSISSFLHAAGQFFSDLAAVHWLALLLGLAFFGLNLTLRSRAFFQQPARRLPRRRLPVAADLGRVLRGRRLQQRRARARRRRDQAVPDALVDPGLALSDRRRGVLRRVDLRRVRGRARADLRVHAGRLPQAAGLLETELVRHLLPGRALPPDAVPDHRARGARPASPSRCCPPA